MAARQDQLPARPARRWAVERFDPLVKWQLSRQEPRERTSHVTAVHLGAGASERRIKGLSADGALANARIVHFATQGLPAKETESVSSNDQAEPALLLTPPAAASEDDDGLLTMTSPAFSLRDSR